MLPSFFFVEMFLQVPVADFFHFFVVVYFENCFVQTSLQRVSGYKHVSSFFWYRFLLKFVWHGYLLKDKLVSTCRRQRCFVQNVFRHFLGRDSSVQSLGWECFFRDSWVQIFPGFFRSDFSSVFFWKCYLHILGMKKSDSNTFRFRHSDSDSDIWIWIFQTNQIQIQMSESELFRQIQIQM